MVSFAKEPYKTDLYSVKETYNFRKPTREQSAAARISVWHKFSEVGKNSLKDSLLVHLLWKITVELTFEKICMFSEGKNEHVLVKILKSQLYGHFTW